MTILQCEQSAQQKLVLSKATQVQDFPGKDARINVYQGSNATDFGPDGQSAQSMFTLHPESLVSGHPIAGLELGPGGVRTATLPNGTTRTAPHLPIRDNYTFLLNEIRAAIQNVTVPPVGEAAFACNHPNPQLSSLLTWLKTVQGPLPGNALPTISIQYFVNGADSQ
ncbi:hypothetical protein WJX74_000710 [Apatococcus lobatus]|uniref:Uncharacterized protein n=1 Tax=Apatococcus lobatus TaxID=904363 RepID=A0AAW1S8E8_9CHLO